MAALEAENARLTAALLELHGPPPGPLCRCVNCNDFKPCPGQALSGDGSALKARLDAARKQGRLDVECEPIVDSEGTAWSDLAAFTHGQACKVSSLRAQLAERDDLFKEAEKSWAALARKFRDERDEAERKRDENLVQREDMQTKRKCDQLAAQVERLRYAATHLMAYLGPVPDITSCNEPDFHEKQAFTAATNPMRKLLAETPAASLAAVREQARREALEKAVALFPITNGVAELWTPQQIRTMLRELAAQPAKEHK